MPQIKLKSIPGFSDIADSQFAAGKYAVGLNMQRVVSNAKFGLCRPEVFLTTQVHGDTVPLPVSPIDGYAYQRTELIYLYHLLGSGSTDTSSSGAPSATGGVWYWSTKVDQQTGECFSYVKYRETSDSTNGASLTNDGTLEVFTIATRRQDSLFIAAPPTYSNLAPGVFAPNNPANSSFMQQLSRNAKFAALSSECIYMGEFVHGQTVPTPVSPVDKYAYGYAEVQFMHAWRWTCQGNQFADPTNAGAVMNLLDDVAATVSPAGLVTLNVTYYNNGDVPTNHGRIAVVAMCRRATQQSTGNAPDYVDLSEALLGRNRPLRADVLSKLNDLTRYAACRPEFFQANYTQGQLVALPVSPIDGYAYTRDELFYIYEWANTATIKTDIRIGSWKVHIGPTTGIVDIQLTRVRDGGAYRVMTDGSIRVTTVALRGSQQNPTADYIYDGSIGSGGLDNAVLQNGGFDRWTTITQPVADMWTLGSMAGNGVAQRSGGLTTGAGQALSVGPAGGQIGVSSSKVAVRSGVPYYIGWMWASSGVPAGLYGRVVLYSGADDYCYVDIIENGGLPVSGTPVQVAISLQIPYRGDTVAFTNYGSLPVIGKLDFIPVYAQLQFIAVNINGTVVLDEVTMINQIAPTNAQIAQRGNNSLAFFPALQIGLTSGTFRCPLSFPLYKADGSIIQINQPDLVVSGIQAGQQYTWYPYYNETSGLIESVAGEVGGIFTAAPSQDKYMQWYGPRHVPIAIAPVTFTMPQG